MAGVVVLFGKVQEAAAIRDLLVKRGYDVSAACTLGAQALSALDDLDRGIVVCGYKYADMIYSGLWAQLPKGFRMLLIAGGGVLEDGVEEDVVTLPMPLKVEDLTATLDMMLSSMERQRKKEKAFRPRRDDGDRILLDEAKSVLMGRNHMSEQEAHRYMQKSCMESGRGMAETAKVILTLRG